MPQEHHRLGVPRVLRDALVERRHDGFVALQHLHKLVVFEEKNAGDTERCVVGPALVEQFEQLRFPERDGCRAAVEKLDNLHGISNVTSSTGLQMAKSPPYSAWYPRQIQTSVSASVSSNTRLSQWPVALLKT